MRASDRPLVTLPQAAGTQRVALPLDLRSRHATGEFFLELAAVLRGYRGGSNERQPFDAVGMSRKYSTASKPPQEYPHSVSRRGPAARECPPGLRHAPATDRRVPRHRRLAAATLVVIEEGATLCEQVVLRQEVIVTRTWTAVENDDERAGPPAA